jgi:hypothetical protein
MGFVNNSNAGLGNGIDFVELSQDELKSYNKIINKSFFQQYGKEFEIGALETVMREKTAEINILKQERAEYNKKFEPIKKLRMFFEKKIEQLNKLDKKGENPEIQLKILEAEENIMKDETVYEELSAYFEETDIKISNFESEIKKISDRLATLKKKGE